MKLEHSDTKQKSGKKENKRSILDLTLPKTHST